MDGDPQIVIYQYAILFILVSSMTIPNGPTVHMGLVGGWGWGWSLVLLAILKDSAGSKFLQRSPPPFASFKPLLYVFALMKLKCSDIHSLIWLCNHIIRYMYSRCESLICHLLQMLSLLSVFVVKL